MAAEYQYQPDANTSPTRKQAKMTFNPILPQQLSQQLAGKLPGRSSQEHMAPVHCDGRHFQPAPATAKRAAVVALLYPHAGKWHLPLTLRAAHLKHHAGQIGLPGGRIEPGESPEQAALRELHEELNIAPDGIQVIGRLSPIYLYVSDFHVTPIVAWCSERREMEPNAAEVAELIELPIRDLVSPKNLVEAEVEIPPGVDGPDTAIVPTIQFKNHCIWGATAIMLAEFSAVLTDCQIKD